ncbi:MAG: peptide chain release factor N(5)-glutamine methyltransferase [Methylococcaceae bacterium]|nr:peptide chain release factor N(5)-glutamine methyltransferase [Methylococcaceae bacterium]
MQTIQSAITEATALLIEVSDSAALDAEVLLCHILEKDRSYLRAWSEKRLSSSQRLQFQKLLQQRLDGQPIAYLVGKREFWSRDFKVSPDVLIPRPDTELLIELCLPLIPENEPCKIIDLGTGSGIIGVTLAAERPNAIVIASDISEKSLKIAKENAASHQLKNISFQQSSWLDDIAPDEFDLIISNPPYIAADDPHLKQGDLRFEPQHALVADDDGLKDISLIAKSAYSYLKQGGHLLIEHGFEQQEMAQMIFQTFSYANIQTHKDLAGLPRVTSGQKLNDT